MATQANYSGNLKTQTRTVFTINTKMRYMKRIKISNTSRVIIALFTTSLLLSSCIKNYRDGETKLQQPAAKRVNCGRRLEKLFSSQALVYPATDPADTTIFRINYASTNVAPVNENVQLEIDTADVAAYNTANGLTGNLAYVVMPDSLYAYTATSATVAAGQSYSPSIPFVVFPAKVSDPTISYMLPIKIKSGPAGAFISGDFNEIYYHIIGNPIAGTYEQFWSRWNAADSVSVDPYAYQEDVGPVTFAPSSPTEISVGSQGTGETDIIDFTNTDRCFK